MTTPPTSTHPPDASESAARRRLAEARLVVLKVGSALLAPEGRIEPRRVHALAASIARLRAEGRRVVLVSSGAIAAGFRAVGYDAVPASIIEKQAAASVGQPRLMSLYTAALDAHALTPAQVLLTADDLRDRPRALMARRTLLELLERNAVPIVNENDAVAFEEIAFGDNDRLSALVAQSVGADALALLSVADAVRENQGRGPIIPCAHDIDATLAHAGGHSSSVGVGGMRAKLEAARIATHAGTTTVIAGGREENVIERLFAGERLGTIVPASQRRSARRAWIAHAARPAGRLLVDAGAVRALTTRGASLLPAGLLRVEGDFERGVVVEIVDEATGRAIARGLCEYASTEANAIAGRRASEIEAALGYRYADELVHRDDLSLLPTTARTDEDDAP